MKRLQPAQPNQHTLFYLKKNRKKNPEITGRKVFVSSVHLYCRILVSAGVCLRHAVLLNLFLFSAENFISNDKLFLMVRSQQWTYVTVVDMKSPSFVCLTSEVRVLFVASCFEVCSQQYGQCLFVSPGTFCLRLSHTKLFGLISWQRNPVRCASHYLYQDKINS